MKNRNLFPVDTRNAVLPGHYNQLKEWIEKLPQHLSHPYNPPPKATLLCGIPGVGKGTAARVIASTLGRPLFLLDGAIPLTTLNRVASEDGPSVLWVDNPGNEHAPLMRWLQDSKTVKVFVVFTSDTPHRLPHAFTRADIIDSVWHLDLPTLRQRSAFWGELLSARIPGYHTHDSVQLGQISLMFTPAEIRAAYGQAVRSSDGLPSEGALIDVVLALKPLALRMEENVACLRAWACEHASPVASCDRDAGM